MYYICDLFNDSINKCRFPSVLIKASSMPVSKNGHGCILPVISKILKKSPCRQGVNFIEPSLFCGFQKV